MNEYIEREAALLEIEEWAYTFCECDYVWPHVIESITKLPAADARPVVRGRWIEKEKDGVWWYACSACGEHIPNGRWGQEWHSTFCPNCGADMREDGNG